MAVYIAILRGINVSGSNKLKMDDLKATLRNHGFEGVSTYIQSGNIRFEYSTKSSASLAKEIREIIKNEFEYEVPVIVMQSTELEEVVAQNPFLNQGADESFLHVTFLDSLPAREDLDKLENIQTGEDQFVVYQHWIYLFCPNGYGRTKLTNNFFENKLRLSATTRNWKTLLKLREMAT